MSFPRLARTHALVALLLVAACAGPAPAPEPGPEAPAVIPPFTTAFREPGVLVAERVRIEGPVGLLEHFAAVQDPERFEYVAEATDEGFRQRWTLLPGVFGEIRGQLDGWQIAALSRLEVLERHREGPVVLEASGDVFVSAGLADQQGLHTDQFRKVGHRPGEG